MKFYKTLFVSVVALVFFSCKENPKKPEETTKPHTSETTVNVIKTEEVVYAADGKSYKSFIAYKGDSTEIKPVVFVIPEWWGLNNYAKNRAKQLAELGYFAMAVDFYGDGKVVDHPKDANQLASQFYGGNPALAKSVFDAAKAKALTFKNADKNKMAVIGYCFGGAMALNMARQETDLKGAVSFHGNLMTGVKPTHSQSKILVLNGEADAFVPQKEIDAFKKEMDSAKIQYKLINYPKAIHAFTNPEATEIGKKFDLKIAYNKEADEKSWQEMKSFLAEIFK